MGTQGPPKDVLNAHSPGNRSKALGLLLLLVLSLALPLSVHGWGGDDYKESPEDVVAFSRSDPKAPIVPGLTYAALGPLMFSDEVQPLLDWKTQKGVKAHFFPFDSEKGYADFPGRDKQESIRNFLVSLKDQNRDLRWLLLVGDGELLPSRNTYINGSASNGSDDHDNFVLSDYYYSGLNSSWDLNGNNIFGEDIYGVMDEYDWLPSLYVGRLPASNEMELEHLVQKQLRYERDPAPGSWSSSTLLVGSLMDRPNVPNNPSTPGDEGFDAYKDNAYELVRKVKNDLPGHVLPLELYDYELEVYGGYNQLFDILNRSSFTSHYEMGFSTVLLACHGDSNGNCTNYLGESGGKREYWGDYQDYIDYDTAETITNGEKLPLLYISSCASLNFTETDDTNMERVLRNKNGGAIAIIGASKDTFRGEYRPEENYTSSYGNWWQAREFFRLIYGGHPRPGEALYMQKWNYIQHVFTERDYSIEEFRMFYNNNLAYNLLGDPEGPIWTGVPRKLDVGLPDPLYQDNSTFKASVRDRETGAPVRGAVLTLMDPSDPSVYYVGRSDAAGNFDFEISIDSLRDLRVTVTSDGAIPSVLDLKVASRWNIKIDEKVEYFPDPPTALETMDVAFTIMNMGLSTVNNITLTVTHSRLPEGGDSPPPEIKLISKIGPGQVHIQHYTRFTAFEGTNRLEAVADIIGFPYREGNYEDNILVVTFQANEKVSVAPNGFPDDITTMEDTPLSELYGNLNISSYIKDLDQYPQKVRTMVEVLSGRVNTTLTDGLVLEVIPEKDWFGNASLRIEATDGPTTAFGTMDIRVLPVNDPPEFLSVPYEIEAREDRPYTFMVSILDVDSEGLELTLSSGAYDLNSTRDGQVHTFNITFQPDNSLVGENKLTIDVIDASGASASWDINLRVEPTNDPPTVNAPPFLTARSGRTLNIDLDIADQDGDREFLVTATWQFGTFRGNRSLVSLKVNRSVASGTYPLDIWVDDGGGNGTAHIQVMVEVVKDEAQGSTLIVIVITLVLITALIGYGVLIRVREVKQRAVLEGVGTDSPLEAKSISEAVLRDPARGRGRESAITAPPVPPEVEGDLARREMEVEVPTNTEEMMEPPDELTTDLEEVMDDLLK